MAARSSGHVLRVLPEGILDGAELAVGDVEEVDKPSFFNYTWRQLSTPHVDADD